MPLDQLLNDALLFAAAALLLVLIAQLFGTPRRRGLLPRLVIVATGVCGLWLLQRYAGRIPSETVLAAGRETALGVVALGVIQIIVLFVFQTLLARRNVPRILDDLFVALALVVYVIYRLNAVGVNLAGLITTSAVLTGALAFSAQETLGNLWGGIALQVERTCRIGDWVQMDNVIGQVVSIRWRYMAIATVTNETIVIPNATAMKNRITVVARRGEEHLPWRRYVNFDVEYEYPPGRVIALVEKALAQAEIPGVAPTPRPLVGCINFKESGIEYAVAYSLDEVSRYWQVDSEIRVHVYAALMREGLGIPFPRRVVEMRGDLRTEVAQRGLDQRVKALASMDLFASLTDAERAALAHELATSQYAADDIVCRAGEAADSLYLLARGSVSILSTNASGERHRLAALEAPAYFGEMGLLLGQPRAATVVATAGDTLCYRLNKRGFDAIIRARPALAEMMAKALAERQAANDATLQALGSDMRTRQAIGSAKDLLRRIQQFFGL